MLILYTHSHIAFAAAVRDYGVDQEGLNLSELDIYVLYS